MKNVSLSPLRRRITPQERRTPDHPQGTKREDQPHLPPQVEEIRRRIKGSDRTAAQRGGEEQERDQQPTRTDQDVPLLLVSLKGRTEYEGVKEMRAEMAEEES